MSPQDGTEHLSLFYSKKNITAQLIFGRWAVSSASSCAWCKKTAKAYKIEDPYSQEKHVILFRLQKHQIWITRE